jgi:hypothetical protein
MRIADVFVDDLQVDGFAIQHAEFAAADGVAHGGPLVTIGAGDGIRCTIANLNKCQIRRRRSRKRKGPDHGRESVERIPWAIYYNRNGVIASR